MGDITYKLKHEHRVIERALRALDNVCALIQGGEAVPAEAIRELVDFFKNFADQYHHDKEEKYLFPALIEAGLAHQGGATELLSREHETERSLIRNLEREASTYDAGNPDSRLAFAQVARRYVDLMVEHFEKEDRALFRLASDLLDERAQEELSRKFMQAEAELGPSARERYEQFASSVEEKWA
jgi:hemerythrin-like domain-containing protein